MSIRIIKGRKAASLVAVVLASAALAACGSNAGSGGTTTSTTAGAGNSGTTTTTSGGPSFLACEVTDTGGINDRSFNQSAWAGLQQAQKQDPSISIKYLPSSAVSEYTPNINTFLGEHCGIIVTVGFDMGAATGSAAKANPSEKFAIVDCTPAGCSYSPGLTNIDSLSYETNQSAFLGGYIAASMSKTGTVGTFGGQNIPPVTIYMDGWAAGVLYYDQHNNKSVKVLGWTPAPGNRANGQFNGTGEFTNDFTNEGKGQTDTASLIAQGADIIFPVAGAVGLGAVAAVKAANSAGKSVAMEWVDTDGCISDATDCSLFITSVEKGITVSVEGAVMAAAKGTFKGGTYVGTLKNNGVGIAPYHDWASKVPSSLQSEITTLTQGIESGSISVDPTTYPNYKTLG